MNPVSNEISYHHVHTNPHSGRPSSVSYFHSGPSSSHSDHVDDDDDDDEYDIDEYDFSSGPQRPHRPKRPPRPPRASRPRFPTRPPHPSSGGYFPTGSGATAGVTSEDFDDDFNAGDDFEAEFSLPPGPSGPVKIPVHSSPSSSSRPPSHSRYPASTGPAGSPFASGAIGSNASMSKMSPVWVQAQVWS